MNYKNTLEIFASVIRVKVKLPKKRRANHSECVCGPAVKPIDGSAVNVDKSDIGCEMRIQLGPVDTTQYEHESSFTTGTWEGGLDYM